MQGFWQKNDDFTFIKNFFYFFKLVLYFNFYDYIVIVFVFKNKIISLFDLIWFLQHRLFYSTDH